LRGFESVACVATLIVVAGGLIRAGPNFFGTLAFVEHVFVLEKIDQE